MRSIGARRLLDILGWVAAALYLLVGFGELVLADGPLGRRLLFLAFLAGFAALVVGGLRMLDRRPWPGAAFASAGAILGGLALFWTGIALVLAVAVVVLAVVCARRASSQTAVIQGS